MKSCFVLVFLLFSEVAFSRHVRNMRIRNHRKAKNLQDPTSIQYYTRPSQNLTIPIMIHVDKVLSKKLASEHGPKMRQKIKFITKEVLKEVKTLYRTMNQNINFKLLGTRFLKNNTKVLKIDENVSKYLKSYCEWQAEKKKKWYYSILLTGLDLFYLNEDGKEVRRSTGRGYMGGMCNYKKSCALLEWHPRNIGYLLAHEIGHSLGMSHDGPPNNNCKAKGHIMAAKYDPMRHPKTWTHCSRRSLKLYIQSKRSWCLRPEHVNYT